MKKTLTLFVMICAFVLLNNCETNDNFIIEESRGNKSLTEIDFGDLQSKIGENDTFSKTIASFKNNTSSFTKSKSIADNFEIGTDLVIMVENQNYVHYTLKLLKTSNQPSSEFYNLIFVQEKTTSNISSKIIKYIPTRKWLSDQSKPYSGYVELVPNDLFTLDHISKSTQSKSANGSCITGISGSWVCDANNNHSPADCYDEKTNPFGECRQCGAEYVVKLEYGQCPKTEFDLNEGTGGVTVDLDEETDPNTSGDGEETDGSNSTETKPLVPCKNKGETDINGNCLEVPDEIILDTTFVNSIAICAYNLLKNNIQFNNILDKLIPKNSKYDVKFVVKNLDTPNGTTTATYSPLKNDITITLNKDLIDTGSIVSIAERILHEAVHARLFEAVKSIGGLNKLNEFTNEDSEIGKLAACFKKYRTEEQHEFLWENYVEEIANGVEAFHKLYPKNYDRFHEYMLGTDGYNKTTFYKLLAKAGLSKTSYYKKLLKDEQEIISNFASKLKANGKKIKDYKTCK